LKQAGFPLITQTFNVYTVKNTKNELTPVENLFGATLSPRLHQEWEFLGEQPDIVCQAGA
jgi:hypothetical protein